MIPHRGVGPETVHQAGGTGSVLFLTVEWVKCHRPMSLDGGVQLAEDHLAAVPGTGVSFFSLPSILHRNSPRGFPILTVM